ncbi:hypothetical protein HPP92_014035 [Vanilla planifolia]|uniref:Uncharacterized protein n=1 Tax=Vanilla planifolia TaxID=51239 RepID=A0A835QVY9_VANPL|nr:hypothetical protein HPP92_014035 [Vanilla planifolia]
MGRENKESKATYSSSIALLQERFRQLQRTREMREKRELLRLQTEEEYPSSIKTRWFSHRDSAHPSRPICRNKLGQVHGGDESESQAMEISLSMTLRPDNVGNTKKFDETDVDTSLHL